MKAPTLVHRSFAALLIGAAMLLAGCATGTPVAAPTATPGVTPSPTCAVPAQPGATPPPDCVVYDPEASMALNDAHKERMPSSDEDARTGAELVSALRSELASIADPPTEAGVREAFAAAGLSTGVQTLQDGADLRFGATFSSGDDAIAECVYGSVGPGGVDIEIGGLVMDGGCLAMDGH